MMLGLGFARMMARLRKESRDALYGPRKPHPHASLNFEKKPEAAKQEVPPEAIVLEIPDLSDAVAEYYRWPELREYINHDSPRWQQELIDDLCERIKAHTRSAGEFMTEPDPDRAGEVIYLHRDAEGDLQFDYFPLEGNVLGAERLVVTNLSDRAIILDASCGPEYPWSTSVRSFHGGEWLVWIYEESALRDGG